ncbi:MAG: NAD(P)-dependent oxidoreductase [Gemmatimonadales bacterium]|nr:NAD(P)-dependent oxidoreductase [Gemmatimonadales bacterium]
MIFVTGGTGLVGQHVLQRLSISGNASTALVRDDRSADIVRSLGAKPVRGSIEDPGMWREVRDCRAIVHTAAIIAARVPWARFERINVRGTALAARRASQLGVPIIHISSVAVYGRSGETPDRSVAEDSPFRPLPEREFYARSKRLAEEALWEEAAGGAACALRPCVVYGRADRLFLPKIVALAKRGWLPQVGNGTRPMAIVHAESVAEAVCCALGSDVAWGRAFNVTNDDDITPAEFIQAVASGLGRRIRIIRVPEWAALAAAGLDDTLRRTLGRTYPVGSVTGAVRWWRGGNPYRSTAAHEVLSWTPDVRHRTAVAEAVRQSCDEHPARGSSTAG